MVPATQVIMSGHPVPMGIHGSAQVCAPRVPLGTQLGAIVPLLGFVLHSVSMVQVFEQKPVRLMLDIVPTQVRPMAQALAPVLIAVHLAHSAVMPGIIIMPASGGEGYLQRNVAVPIPGPPKVGIA
jgi:hypothetical protein